MNSFFTNTLQKIKIFFFISILLPSLSIRICPTKASAPIVKVSPDLISSSLNETFIINITILNVQNLYAIEISLGWNETVLQLVNADVRLNINESHPDGVLYSPVYWEDKKNLNNYSLWGTSYNPAPPFYGSGNIVSLTFAVKAVGNCTFNLQSKLYDWPPPERIPRISKPIDHVTLGGTFVIPEFSSTFILLPFMLITVIALILIFLLKARGLL